jgi:hypothetical protein
MIRMREEMAPLRDTLRQLESQLYFGAYDDAQEALAKIEDLRAELGKAFGNQPNLLTVRKALNFADNVGEVADDRAKFESWTKAMIELPAATLLRWLARRPVIELHDLRSHVPAGGRLASAISSLFGRTF